MMPSGQFYTVVISVSDIFPLDKGHYISVHRELYHEKQGIASSCDRGNIHFLQHSQAKIKHS